MTHILLMLTRTPAATQQYRPDLVTRQLPSQGAAE
jgi:hypothetical protein